VRNAFARTFATGLVVLATPCVVVAVAVMLFLNPVWVGFDQGRSDVTQLTGYTPGQVSQITGSILSDLVFGPPRFDVAVDGQTTPVLDAGERGHMADVRNVLLNLGLVALIAALALLAIGFASRGGRWFWAAVQAGGKLLVGGVVIVGLGFALFFDQAFLLFHQIFFAPGTYMFDIRTEKLVQLFPDQFWSETSVAIAAAVLVLGLIVVFAAGKIAGPPEPAARADPSAPPEPASSGGPR
jgi:integral membrane protein (TIGR01906 family)